MKIGLMLRHMGRQPGGIGTYTEMMVRYILRADHTSQYVLFYCDPSQLHSFPAQPNVEEVLLPSRFKLFWDQVSVPAAAHRRKLDLIFNLKGSVPLFTACLTVSVQHGADHFAMPEQYELLDRAYVRLFMPWFWRKANAVIAVSNDASARLAKLMDSATAAKLHTIYHGVDRRFSPSPNPAAIQDF